MDSTDLVLVYKSESGVYVYPHNSMKAEVVNDIINGKYMAVTYCPITRSGNCWNRIYNNDTLLLTASGYLYKDNLMPYDINSESIWSQMLLLGAKGKFKGEFVSTYQLVETEWNNIKSYYPEARIFYIPGTENTTYSTNLKYTIEPDDNNTQNIDIPDNERIFGLVGKWGVELFQFDLFSDSIRLFDLTFENQQLIVAGSLNHNFIVAFEKKYTMTPVQNEFPVIMKDNSRTRWNIFGEAVSGQKQGERLSSPPSYFALGWAWKDLFDRIEVL
ncbi:MAG: DUF3179 domain-containing protein [Bacteroidales bacterium]|nr:DUF3179 domain-containing protein [Bacteroidales bacterium]